MLVAKQLNITKKFHRIYHKESLSIRTVDFPNLTESILCQVTMNDKPGYVLVV